MRKVRAQAASLCLFKVAERQCSFTVFLHEVICDGERLFTA